MSASADVYRRRPKHAADGLLGDLARDGVSCMRLSTKAMARLRTAAAPFAARLQQGIEENLAARQKIKFKHTLMHLLMRDLIAPEMEDLAAVVRDTINETEIERASCEYFQGQRVFATSASLKLNFAGQSMGVPTRRARAKTGGIHIDSNSRPIMNGVLYLSDVEPENGPFQYVAGSNHWAYDIEDRAMRKAIDEIGVGGANGELPFLSLPPEYRRKAAFGWDVEDGSPESEAMLASLKTFTSDTTDVVWFDADGAHRGGLVDQGRRLSLLIHLVMR